MTVLFRLPDLGEGVVETEIIRWLVETGDEIVEDQPMVEVMTDKATVEIPAPSAGTITVVHARAGQVVPVGTVIVEIQRAAGAVGAAPAIGSARDTHAAEPAAAARPQSSATSVESASASRGSDSAAGGARVQATPLVRRLAGELQVDLSVIAGSGPNGRVLEGDVRAASAAQIAAPQGTEVAAVTGATAATGHAATGAGSAVGGAHPEGAAERIHLRGMRRSIAEHMTRAQQVPVVTVVEECDLSAVESARRATGLGYLPWVVHAVVAGLREVPALNAVLDSERRELVRYDRVDMGIAVQSPDGLVVPLLHDCAELSLREIEARVSNLAERARAGTLAPGELRGGTFTITSAGRFGGLFTTPLLNVPQVGILGLHRASDRAVVVDGEIVVRRMANLSVTFDHRALDGIDASRFLLTVIGQLQSAAPD